MSALKVGDFVELVTVDALSHAANIGFRGIVMAVCVYADMGECVRFDDGEWARSVNCRKIDPPTQDEPRTEFLPCSPEFTEDLARWMKRGVRA